MDAILNAFDVMKTNAPVILTIIAGLWVIQALNWALHYRLNIFGIYPRRLFGLVGVVFSPFLHGNATHLFMNSIPLFILGSFVTIYGLNTFLLATLLIALFSGFAVWCFGRQALHIGASGIILGYFGFLLASAYNQHTAVAIISAIVCLFYLGSMLYGIIPNQGRESWEAHLFGFIAGVLVSFIVVAH